MSKVYKNKVIIEGDEVIKKYSESTIKTLEYLSSVDFKYFPDVVYIDKDIIKYRYIENTSTSCEKDYIDMMNLLGLLHYKTVFFKDVSKNKYRGVYNKISGNIEYLKKYYEELINEIENNVYMSPSAYLFARNYSILDSSLRYASRELKKWFKMVENKTKERVCTLHNNLSIDHYIKSDINYLISWDNSLVDTPILDLYKFYKKEGFAKDFKLLLSSYLENFNLLEDERLLFSIMISIPPKIKFIKNEYNNIKNIKDFYSYIYNGSDVVSEK